LRAPKPRKNGPFKALSGAKTAAGEFTLFRPSGARDISALKTHRLSICLKRWMIRAATLNATEVDRLNSYKRRLHDTWPLYLFLLPALVYIILFHYVPMYGIQIAFKDFKPSLGFSGSHWAGMKYFEQFFHSSNFERTLVNTVTLSVQQLLITFPLPILLALMLNSLRSLRFKKVMQTVTYAPYFISTVVLVSMLTVLLSPTSGVVNNIIKSLGGKPVIFMARPEWFRFIYIFSTAWQTTGWSSIVYIAALAGVSPELHEAASIDGASKLKRIWHIDLPSIQPTIVIILVLSMGNIMSVGFEKALLMQKGMNLATSEIIPTFVYKVGILQTQYSFSAAVGLFNSVINTVLLVMVNLLAKRFASTSIW
jgi:putative aldouronate transport system permease protein